MSLADKNALFGKGSNNNDNNKPKPVSKTALAAASKTSGSKPTTNTTTTSSSSTSKTSSSSTTTSSSTAQSKTLKSSTTISPQLKLKKIEEAKEESEKGMKYLKKTIFNWSPDHLAAAPCFENSANAYKTAGEYKMSYMMFMKASESHEGCNCSSAAGMACVKASEVAKLGLDISEVVESMRKASQYFGIDGKIDKAAEMIYKLAKEYDSYEKFDDAITAYMEACDMILPDKLTKTSLDGIYPGILDWMRDAFKCYLKSNNLQDALDFAKKMVIVFDSFDSEMSMCKTMVSMTIIQLAMGDIVAADQLFLEQLGNNQYINSKECRLAESFVMAIKLSDIDALDQAQRCVDLNYLEREIQILAKNLSIFGFDTDYTAESTGVAALDQISKDMNDLLSNIPEQPEVEEEEYNDNDGLQNQINDTNNNINSNNQEEEEDVDLC